MLSANYAAMREPATGSVDCDHTFAAQFPADRYRWTSVPKGDQAQVFSLKVGRKVARLADVPAEFHRTLIAQFPERV